VDSKLALRTLSPIRALVTFVNNLAPLSNNGAGMSNIINNNAVINVSASGSIKGG
jgi:hypothetical protein